MWCTCVCALVCVCVDLRFDVGSLPQVRSPLSQVSHLNSKLASKASPVVSRLLSRLPGLVVGCYAHLAFMWVLVWQALCVESHPPALWFCFFFFTYLLCKESICHFRVLLITAD